MHSHSIDDFRHSHVFLGDAGQLFSGLSMSWVIRGHGDAPNSPRSDTQSPVQSE